MSIFILLIIIY